MCNYKIAFYKGKKPGSGLMTSVFRFLDSATRVLTKGPYSHCELINVLVLAIVMAVFVVKYYH